MKILFPISAFYPSQIGGPANTIYWHCRALKKNGINPIIITTTMGILDLKIIDIENKVKDVGELDYIDYNWKANFKLLIKSIKKLREVDCIHFSSLFFWPNFFLAFLAILIFNKKIVWSPRGEMSENALIYGSKLKGIYIKLIKKFLQHKILFHSTCNKESNEILKYFGSNTNIIELPNYLSFNPPLKAISHKYFLFIGRIHPIKALDNLILALKYSEPFLESDYKLLIAGDTDGTKESDEFMQKIKNLIQSNKLAQKIEMLGQVVKAKDSIYSNAYFTILPSHTENFGNVVIESLAQGTPVIASKGSPWGILEENNAGFWVKNDVKSIAKVIDEVIELDENKYFKLRENALTVVTTYYDINRNIHKWIEVYRKITSNYY